MWLDFNQQEKYLEVNLKSIVEFLSAHVLALDISFS